MQGKNVLVVYAHPEPLSMSGSLKNSIVSALIEAGAKVTVSDLYEMDFNPVVYPEDFPNRADPNFFSVVPEQRNAVQKGQLPKDVQLETDKLRAADFIITVCPLWWGSVPAILKGWFDKILIAGVAWDYTNMFKNGLGKGKKVLNVFCIGAPEQLYVKGSGQQQELDQRIHHITSGFGFCGYDIIQFKHYHSVDRLTDAERKDQIKEIGAYVSRLDTQPLMQIFSE